MPRLARSVGALPAARLIELLGTAANADRSALAQLWLGAHPDAPEAFAVWFNLGVGLLQGGDAAQAAIAYANALVLKPELHEASVNLGLALEAQGRRDEALRTWRRALPEAATRRVLHMHLGRMLEDDGRLEQAAAELRAALRIDPDQPDVIQHWVHLRQRMAAWPVLDSADSTVPDALLRHHAGPLGALALFDDPVAQREVAAAWIARKVPAAPARLAPASGYRHDRMRIGYLSSDFCRHAMSFLIAEVLERHDRADFEVFGYCASPEDGSDLRARVVAAFDHHVPIGALSDEAAARRIRDDEIDILVDLNGLTRGARLGVLRWKPAPVQATYLGYIGPVPLPELDWLIADAVAIPPEAAPLYAPPPLALEGCYQANDSRPLDLPPVSRAEEGLPATGFVFACFSHHYKITPAIFGAWTRIVAAVPGSVLWLVDDGEASRRNLGAHWAAAGLAAERLVFAPRVDPARYRARMALGDLFLDTSPYNAGTIASDALRMGLPLLTLAGRAFSARMATSLLTAIGMPEMIAPDLDGYVATAARLARTPAEIAVLRGRLGGDAWARSLGDACGFTRRLEAAYRRIRLSPPT
ncbi:MAG: tetratricopeptide repeat protein [Acetobacteraceae bacterium]|nr:tetratricopeptide repeat protein [Acetobacteraceae bacterium]